MKLTITAKNMTVTPGITARIEKKTERMSRYLRADTEMQIRMHKEKNGMRTVEITVPMGNNVILRAEASTTTCLWPLTRPWPRWSARFTATAPS